ncbi:MAG: sensor histidine kinase [Bacteroidetes bacterium]|nr:sensor histidine kinase [Bacteroidota bacterium]
MSKIGLSIQMNHFAKALIILVMVSSVGSIAQAPNAQFLPLQPHKVQWANAVIKNALKTKDTLQLAEGWYLYGKIYEASGDWLTAKRYFLKSLRIQEKQGDSFELARLYIRLYSLEWQLFHYAETYQYAHLAQQVAERIKSEKALSLVYGAMQALHDTDWSEGGAKPYPAPNSDSSFYYLKKREKLALKTGNQMDLLAVMMSLSHRASVENDVKSIGYAQKVVSIYQIQKDTTGEIKARIGLANAYIAFNYLKEAGQEISKINQLQNASSIKTNDNEHYNRSFAWSKSKYYEQIGNYKKALENEREYTALERQIIHADREGVVSRLSIEYETEKKEVELKAKQRELQLSQQSQQNQQRFVGILAILLVGALTASIAFYRISVKNQRLSESNALLVHEQNHRVKNNLQLVSSLLNLQLNRLNDDATKNVLEETQLRIEVMSTLQRTLYSGQTLGEVNLHDFLNEIIKIGLQTFGYEHLQTQTHIDSSLHLPIDHAMRIGLIVNELLTNACKYAFPDHPNPQWTLSCHQANRLWTLQVADNGPGFIPPQPITRKSSFGMRLIQLQAEQLYANFGFEIKKGSLFQMKFKI